MLTLSPLRNQLLLVARWHVSILKSDHNKDFSSPFFRTCLIFVSQPLCKNLKWGFNWSLTSSRYKTLAPSCPTPGTRHLSHHQPCSQSPLHHWPVVMRLFWHLGSYLLGINFSINWSGLYRNISKDENFRKNWYFWIILYRMDLNIILLMKTLIDILTGQMDDSRDILARDVNLTASFSR